MEADSMEMGCLGIPLLELLVQRAQFLNVNKYSWQPMQFENPMKSGKFRKWGVIGNPPKILRDRVVPSYANHSPPPTYRMGVWTS